MSSDKVDLSGIALAPREREEFERLSVESRCYLITAPFFHAEIGDPIPEKVFAELLGGGILVTIRSGKRQTYLTAKGERFVLHINPERLGEYLCLERDDLIQQRIPFLRSRYRNRMDQMFKAENMVIRAERRLFQVEEMLKDIVPKEDVPTVRQPSI